MNQTRHDILKECPEEFADKLEEFIDDVERSVNDAFNELDAICDVSDLHRVDDAHKALKDLAKDLY